MTGRTIGFAALAIALAGAALASGCAESDSRQVATIGVTSEPGVTSAPGPAVDAAGRGWLDEHDDWSGGSASTSAAMSAAEDVAAAPEAGAAAPKAAAGAPETAAPDPAQRPGPGLRAGSVDDNERFADYLAYREQAEALGIAGRPFDPRGRLVVTVRGADGRPLLGAHLRLADGSDAATTGADGRALLFRPVPERDDVGIVDDAGPPQEQQQGQDPAPTVTAPVPSADAVVVAEYGQSSLEAPVQAGVGAIAIELGATRAATASVPLDVAFVIDATGSMSDEIERLRGEMIRVARRIAAMDAHPDVRFGMTIYRDRGDLFVTRSFDFTGDVEAFTRALGEVVAADGGDDPEDVEAALADAFGRPAWRAGAVQLAFLVADAPPHLDYGDSTPYTDSIARAREAGVRIFPIASSGLDDTGELVFRELAQATLGRFVFLTYGADGASPGDETDHHVGDYSVLALDDLVVRLVEEELAGLDA